MRQSTRQYKADLEELADGYQEARDVEFSIQLKDFLEDFITHDYGNAWNIGITEDDVRGFIDSFDFPSESDWCADEYESRRDSFEDAKYEQMRDERMGL